MSGVKPNGYWVWVTAHDHAIRYHVVAFDFGVKRNILRMLRNAVAVLRLCLRNLLLLTCWRYNLDGVFFIERPRRSLNHARMRWTRPKSLSNVASRLLVFASATKSWRWHPVQKP